jgi:LPS export ABC transporter protein LptC
MNLGSRSHQRNTGAILASLLTLCALTCLSCEEEESRTIPTRQPLPQEVLEDVLLKEIHKGRVVWVLSAARALNYEEEKVIKVYDIHLEFYDADQCVSSVLTADSGVVFASNKDMQAAGNVKIVAPENAILHTDLLQWDNRERLISTEHEVRIETTESTITGVGFESDPELKHMKIREQFRARKTESQD